jgi:hypothetical protein
MRNRHRIATIAALTTVAAQSVSAQPLTLDRVVQSGAITGSTPSALAWSPDSRTLASGGNESALALWDIGHAAPPN